jgi:hypothetical protein
MLASAEGTERVSDEELGTVVRSIIAERELRPGV